MSPEKPREYVARRFWTCSINECSRPSAIDIGNCERCLRHYCVVHVESSLHTCEKSPIDDLTWTENRDKELRTLRDSVNNEELLRHASELNHGIKCQFDDTDPLGSSMMGGMHVHLRIRFVDGSNWLARILRQNFMSFSDELSNYIIVSECATMRWLEDRKVPVAKVHGYGLRNDTANGVGVTYMLIDELPGNPLSSLSLSTNQMRKVYGDMADIFCTLQAHPLDKIGSLVFGMEGDICIGPTASDRTGTMTMIGPFDDAKQYYAAWCEEYLYLIADRQLFVKFPVNAYLIFRFLQEQALEGNWDEFEKHLDKGPFFLKHMDDKGDHILVDDALNITGIIDWTFARVVPVYEAFGPSLATANMDDIYNGRAGRSEQDELFTMALRERNESLALYSGSVDKVRRLTFGLGMGVDVSWTEALDLFKGIIAVLDVCPLQNFDWDTWREQSLMKYSGDRRLCRLMADMVADCHS